MRSFEKGLTMIEMLIVIAGLAILSLGIFQVANIGLKSQSRSMSTAQADALRRSLAMHIENEEAWNNSISDPANSNIHCLASGASCVSATGLVFLKDSKKPTANMVYDPTQPANGFTIEGVRCSSFEPVNGNDDCPLRYEIRWEQICASGATCAKPLQYKVKGELFYKPKNRDKSAIRPEKYAFEYTKNVPIVFSYCWFGQAINVGGAPPCGFSTTPFMCHVGVHATATETSPGDPNNCYNYTVAGGGYRGRCIAGVDCPSGGYGPCAPTVCTH